MTFLRNNCIIWVGGFRMLYIIRHGKTDWNAEYRLQGRTDIPLNEEGRQMASKAHDEYEDVHIDICYCSPLIRARETAEILLQGRNVPIVYDERLLEMAFGKFEGESNLFSKPHLSIYKLFKDPENYIPEEDGGESFDDLFKRTGDLLKEIMPAVEQGKDILIVGHGAMNSAIVSQIRNYPLKDFWKESIENCVMKRLI